VRKEIARIYTVMRERELGIITDRGPSEPDVEPERRVASDAPDDSASRGPR
jgi:hypothetical protein